MAVGGVKITTDSGAWIRFWANRHLARAHFQKKGVLDAWVFDRINWEAFYGAMHTVPRMFQVWASKQICNMAATNKFRAKFTPRLSAKCPSCFTEDETCSHVLACDEEGLVNHFLSSIGLLATWLRDHQTDPTLAACIFEFAKARGAASMYDMARGLSPVLAAYAKHQDMIGWRRFMEGMVATECVEIQANFLRRYGIRGSAVQWAIGLSTKLLECTHGQWLYRNVMVHDKTCGIARTVRKEQLVADIAIQRAAEEQLSEEDRYLLEIDLDDLATTSGEKHEYWLLAIQAARRAKRIRDQMAEGIG